MRDSPAVVATGAAAARALAAISTRSRRPIRRGRSPAPPVRRRHRCGGALLRSSCLPLGEQVLARAALGRGGNRAPRGREAAPDGYTLLIGAPPS